jgi:hypothetical protein
VSTFQFQVTYFRMEGMSGISRGNCIDEEALELYSLGTLPEEQTAELEEHLLVCEPCQARLAKEDLIVDRIRAAATRHRRESRKDERHYRPILAPAIAGLALVLALVFGLRWIHPNAIAPAFVVKLEALRGAEAGSQAPAGRPLIVQPDLSGLPTNAYRLELVGANGNVEWKGVAPSGTIPALPPGTYFLRVYAQDGRMLREYGLEVQATAR